MYAITSANVCGKKKKRQYSQRWPASTPYSSLNLAPCQYRIWQAACGWQRPTARLKQFFLTNFLWTVSGSEIFSSSHSSINSQNVTTIICYIFFLSSPLFCWPQAHHSLGKQSAPLPSQFENTLSFLIPSCFSVWSPFLLKSVVSAHSTAPLQLLGAPQPS